MDFTMGQTVYVEGDAAAITTSDYTCRVASPAIVVDDPDPESEYILLSIDSIDGDHNAWVYVKKNYVRNID